MRDAGENVTIVTDVAVIVTSAPPASSAGGAPAPVVWQAFSPSADNTVNWSMQGYQLFAAQSASANAVIIMQASANAQETRVLLFAKGTFGPALDGTLPTNTYGVENQESGSGEMVFGLTQTATVNGRPVPASPMNASAVPKNQFADFTPFKTLQVFMQTGTENGMVLANSITNVPTLTLSASSPSITLTYSSATGSFV